MLSQQMVHPVFLSLGVTMNASGARSVEVIAKAIEHVPLDDTDESSSESSDISGKRERNKYMSQMCTVK